MSSQWKEQCKRDTMILPVEDQYEIAKALAANCGYQLVAEDIERSLEIKELINQYNVTDCNRLIIEGLEALLK